MESIMIRVFSGLIAAFGIALSAQAQSYPAKVVRLVVPFAPGGSSEIIARTLAHRLSENLGQQFIVENKPGGGGNIAMQEVARAEPDGYTLMLGHVGSLAMNPPMFANNAAMKKPPYDANKDFIPVSLVAVVPNIFVVNASVPAKDLKEFVALARAKPGTINYGSAGNGSAGHLAFEYLKMVTGIDIVHVPYKGTGPMLTDLIAGQTQATSAGTPPLLPHVKSGKLRAIAVGTPQRIAALPDVATVAEQGHPGFETSQWYGIIVPAKTPDAIVKKLAEEIGKATRSADVLDRFRSDGTIAVGSTPAEFAEFIRKEQARWGEVVRKSGVKAE
jgi:tripartite-type tricarboxylate transporter receptor subunit TctC